ncbi:MAG TPA: NHL repeat-containing protein [Solirubrobacterales bacterium]|nr:NHL repeat-containing protein [Solirubrobacterales bacterium]
MLLSLVAGIATALADDPSTVGSEEAATYAPGWSSLSELERASEEADVITLPGPVVDSEAAAALPHEDLDREEAIQLVTSVFGEVIEEPAGTFDGLDIRSFRSDHVALVEPDALSTPEGPGGQLGLLSSLLPLRAEGDKGAKELVSLELESSEGELQPQNPLIDVGLPAQLGDGITLPEAGVSIELVDAADRTASNLEQTTAFYPNVAQESDLAVTPTATGVETFMQLRSADAPLSHAFRVQTPAGAELKASPDGGAIVTEGDSTLLRVLPPGGVDAEGKAVPVDLDVAEGLVAIQAKPTPENVYPLLIDPIFENFAWEQASAQSPEWIPVNSPGMTAMWGAWGGPGMTMYSGNFASVSPGAQANWNYYVPRFFTDMAQVGSRPTTYIKQMTMSKLSFFWNFTPWSPGPGSPFLMMGLWSENKGQWVSVGTRDGFQGPLSDPNYQYGFVNPNEVTDAKNGTIALATTESQLPGQRNVKVEQATVELSDKDAPGFGSLGSPAPWQNSQPSAAITYKVSDPGLGVREVQVTQPSSGPTTSTSVTSAGCLGTVAKPCPRSLQNIQHPLQYDPATMPQGENWLRIVAADPILQQAAGEVRVKVDHSKPSLELSGSLTEQAKVGTTSPSYTLKYDATDGDSTAATAQAPFGTAGTGTGQLQRPMGVAIDAAGNRWVVDRDCKCVQKYDPTGKFISQFGGPGTADGQLSDPRGIAISNEGIWVTDFASKRVQLFDLSGTFVRKLAPGSFVEPYAVAVGPGNVLWVSDFGAHTVFRFANATGTPTKVRGWKASPNNQNSSDLVSPIAVATDEAGRLWVTDNNLNRVTAYTPEGQWLGQFGTLGSGNGQLNNPVGIAVAPATGNVLVADGNNNRVQEFRPSGEYIRQFGTAGTANNQFSEPRGIALETDRTLLVADAGNDRITRWTHGSYDPQSGVASTEVKVDGNLLEPKHAPGCATKDCTVSREWTLKADDFSAGQHTLTVTATDAVGLATTKTMTIETHGDLTPPALALSGSMTEQATQGTTRPAYTLKVTATDPGGADERKSGVASTTVKVDGATVDSSSPGCLAGGCSITREWTLNSNSYSVGEHNVQVTATDAAGRVTTKSLMITINRDTAAPEINTTNAFNTLFNRPEGWVEQKSYSYWPFATDANGYGVTSLVVKFDGATVATKTQTCPKGSCETSTFGSLNMVNYDGGAHTAEVLATDGAGNMRKRSWTINIDPVGQITAGEAEDTLEALDVTSAVNTIGPSQEEPSLEGTASGLALENAAGQIQATGSHVPTTIDPSPGGVVTMQVVDPEHLGLCEIQEEGSEPSCIETPASGNDEDGYPGLDPVVISPVSTATNATANKVAQGVAAVAANTTGNVDTITRPLYNGAMIFQAIRDATAPETFSWEVQLAPDQELVPINDQYAVVRYADGIHIAYGIDARPAHDAIGTTVPTKLSVSEGNIITLTVQHRASSPTGGSFVYPVVGGTGWQGGFATHAITMPPPVTWLEGGPSEIEATFEGYEIFSAPEPAGSAEGEASISSAERSKGFIKVLCSHFHVFDGENLSLSDFEIACGNPWTGEKGISLAYRVAMRGRYFYDGNYVWHRGSATNGIDCRAFASNGPWPPSNEEETYTGGKDRRVKQERCVWWGSSPGGNGVQKQEKGHHITAFAQFTGESRGGCGDDCGGTPNPWESFPIPKENGMAYYLWPTGDKEYHGTDCIDCD